MKNAETKKIEEMMQNEMVEAMGIMLTADEDTTEYAVAKAKYELAESVISQIPED